jgi:hypothetical protein
MLQVILLVVAALVIVGFVVLTLFVTNARKKTVQEVKDRLGPSDIILLDEKARCHGLESRGHGYLQTMGCLAVTPDRMLYLQWSPREELEVSRVDILGLDERREHNGRDRGADLLAVKFRNSDAEDGEDVVAWQVASLEAWSEELEK